VLWISVTFYASVTHRQAVAAAWVRLSIVAQRTKPKFTVTSYEDVVARISQNSGTIAGRPTSHSKKPVLAQKLDPLPKLESRLLR